MEVFDHDEKANTTQIIGGYNSSGWVRDTVESDGQGNEEEIVCRGDDSCFLFNLTSNLRFNVIQTKTG
jgi:hypothetical protein